MNHDQLKARQRAERHAHPPNLALRVHRSLSWLHRAELQAGAADADGQFIFLWIAFNAAYATEIDERYRLNEQGTFRAFLQKLVDLDARFPRRLSDKSFKSRYCNLEVAYCDFKLGWATKAAPGLHRARRHHGRDDPR